MGFLDFFRAPQRDGLGDDLRSALATIVRRAMEDDPDGNQVWSVTTYGCRLRGVRVGDWEFTARRIEAQRDETLQAAQPEGREPDPKGRAQNQDGASHD